MRKFFVRGVIFGLFFLLYLLPAVAFSATKPQLQYVCFPETLFVDSLDTVLDICLINQGATGTLTTSDYIVISIPIGTMSDDLVADPTGLDCSSSNGSWFCGDLEIVGDNLLLTIRPTGNVTVQAGEIICCQLSGVDINSSIGLVFLGVNQQISSSRADNPINTRINVFKTTTDRQVFIEIDPKTASSAVDSIPKWNGSQLVDSISISEDATGNVGMSGDLNVAGIINGDISGNAATANYATSADNATNASHAVLADNATSATNAGHATTADSATSASHATTAGDADTVDGKHASDLDESGEIDTKIATHKADASAHHTKTTSFSELIDQATDAQIPDNITINHAATADSATSATNATTAGDADTIDGKHASELIVSESDPTVPANIKDGVSWSEVANIPADIANGDQVGITTELDPTVLASVKDGVSWSEVSGIPAGFADGVDNTGSDLWSQNGSNIYYNAGNVGIGTADPRGKLHIFGHSHDMFNMFIESSDYPIDPAIGLYHYRTNSGFGFAERAGSADRLDVMAYSDRSGTGNVLMTVKRNGNVGIGTTSPNANLHVYEAGTTKSWRARILAGNENKVAFIGSWNNNPIIGAHNAAFNTWETLYLNTDSDLGCGGNVITKGNVGIATTSPSYTLHVNGSAGKPGGGSWASASDGRLKKEIKPLTGALDKMIQLKGVNFEWINPEEHENQSGTQTGLVAQDVEKIFPEWVSEIDPTGKDKEQVAEGEKVKTLYFPHVFNAYLVEAIKELKGRDEAKQAQIEELKAQNDELRTRIEALESR